MKKYKSVYIEAKKIKYKGADLEAIESKGTRKNVKVTFYWPEKFHEFSSPIDIFVYKDMAKAKRVVNDFNKMLADDKKILDIFSHIKNMSEAPGYDTE